MCTGARVGHWKKKEVGMDEDGDKRVGECRLRWETGHVPERKQERVSERGSGRVDGGMIGGWMGVQDGRVGK